MEGEKLTRNMQFSCLFVFFEVSPHVWKGVEEKNKTRPKRKKIARSKIKCKNNIHLYFFSEKGNMSPEKNL